MLKTKTIIVLSFSVLLSFFSVVTSVTYAQADSILTSTGPLQSLTKTLVADTAIEVINVPSEAVGLSEQASSLAQSDDVFSRAKAVVTIDSLWSADPLFASVKAVNDSAVNIDATTGITAANAHSTETTSPYFWLSPANVAQSAQNVAAELSELFPDSATQIKTNEQALITTLNEAQAKFKQTLSEHDFKVFGLADEFVYLTNEFEIPVTGYFIKPEAEWTVDDFGELIKTLYDHGRPHAIHKHETGRDIGLSVTTGGSRMLILETYETSTEDIVTIATGNLAKITDALTMPQGRGGMGGGMGGGGMGGGMGGGPDGGEFAD